MEFNSRFLSFRTGKQKLPEVKKSEIPDAPSLSDEFVTQIVNTIPYAKWNNNRDLLLYFFNNVSEINALVTYIAQKGADIPVKHVQVLRNGKEKDISEKSTVLPLLRKPNKLNNGRQFMVNAISSFLVFGYIPINKIKPVGWEDYSELYLFPGNQFYPIPLKSVNQYGLPASGVDFRLNPIVKYRLFIDNIPFNYDPSQIIMINDSNLSFTNGQYMTGQSRLYSAIRSIKTLSYIYDTVNTLIAGKGAEGIVVKRSRANEVDPGWDETDKKNVEKKLYSYGLTDGKRPIAVTTKDLGFVRLSVPVGDFMPVELKEHEFRSLATALGLQAVIFNDPKASTFNNVLQAEKAGYTTCINPIVNVYYEALTTDLGLEAKGEALRPVFDDIECLQTDRKAEAETNKVWNEVFKELWEQDMITRNQWLEYLGLPRINKPGYDDLKSELKEPEPVIPIEETVEEINTEENEPEE